ncbi:MarR family winged helix-turn-helix transcriptional regulator [Vannielia litorea]|uniref:MarR family protein n=1 Tax=Vannielia litorea TaxID=1217970 RepID=A0A1N6EAE3_9RHOB|nr:MarR family winged helix-turn-helix transcriptional regulator [Vannielia litorea]SIN79963.1 MarR family protein [Vannielia litorea]
MGERDQELLRKLETYGIEQSLSQSALELDAVLQRWRRRAVVRRELGVRAVQELGLSLELAELDALIAVWRPANEFGDEEEGETTVGTVANRLGIDPSRASRLTSELIRKGLVERGVSQEDARRAILKVSENGDRIVTAVRTFKFLTLGHFLQTWTEEEVATFLPLLERFSKWSTAPDDPTDRTVAEITALRESLADLSTEKPDG